MAPNGKRKASRSPEGPDSEGRPRTDISPMAPNGKRKASRSPEGPDSEGRPRTRSFTTPSTPAAALASSVTPLAEPSAVGFNSTMETSPDPVHQASDEEVTHEAAPAGEEEIRPSATPDLGEPGSRQSPSLSNNSGVRNPPVCSEETFWNHQDSFPIAIRYHGIYTTFIAVNSIWTMHVLHEEILEAIEMDNQSAAASQSTDISELKVVWAKKTLSFPSSTVVTDFNLRAVLEFMKRKGSDIMEVDLDLGW